MILGKIKHNILMILFHLLLQCAIKIHSPLFSQKKRQAPNTSDVEMIPFDFGLENEESDISSTYEESGSEGNVIPTYFLLPFFSSI